MFLGGKIQFCTLVILRSHWPETRVLLDGAERGEVAPDDAPHLSSAATRKPPLFSGTADTAPIGTGSGFGVRRLSGRRSHRINFCPGARQQFPPDDVQVVAHHAQARIPQVAAQSHVQAAV